MRLGGKIFPVDSPFFVPNLEWFKGRDGNSFLWKKLDALEVEVEEAVLAGKVVVVNCALLGRDAGMTSAITRVGCVPLRWGTPRLLLLRPDQARALSEDNAEELARSWKLWRYKFDPNTDGWVDGSPNRAEKALRSR